MSILVKGIQSTCYTSRKKCVYKNIYLVTLRPKIWAIYIFSWYWMCHYFIKNMLLKFWRKQSWQITSSLIVLWSQIKS